MRLSTFFVQTLREAPSDAVLTSHKLMSKAGLIRPLSTGLYSLTPMGLRVIRKIEGIVKSGMDEVGGLEMDLPLVQPAEIWKESGRYDLIQDELLRFKDRNSKDMVLAMTHEEAVTHFVRPQLHSHKQLPFMLYQVKLKYRDEARARGGLIRLREFSMKDAYSFHATQEDLDQYYLKMLSAYKKVFRSVGLNTLVVRSATGIMGGAEAHEFMVDTSAGEDTLMLCGQCGTNSNKEVSPDGTCHHCGGPCRETRGIEVGNIFKLGTKFSESMKCHFTDVDGKNRPVLMGCYGIGIGRLAAAIAETSSDSKGLVWPEAVAPFKTIIIPTSPAVRGDALAFYEKARALGHDVVLDDRDERPGVKFKDADLWGIPHRLVISPKSLESNCVEWTARASGVPHLVDLNRALDQT